MLAEVTSTLGWAEVFFVLGQDDIRDDRTEIALGQSDWSPSNATPSIFDEKKKHTWYNQSKIDVGSFKSTRTFTL